MKLSRNEFTVTYSDGSIHVYSEYDMENMVLPLGGIYKKPEYYSFVGGEFLPIVEVQIKVIPVEGEIKKISDILSVANSPYYGERIFDDHPVVISNSYTQKILGRWYIYSYNDHFSGCCPGRCVVLAISDRPVKKIITRSGDAEVHTLGFFVKE